MDFLVLIPVLAAASAGIQVFLVAGDSASSRYLLNTLNIRTVLFVQLLPLALSMLLIVSILAAVVEVRNIAAKTSPSPDATSSAAMHWARAALSVTIVVVVGLLVTEYTLVTCVLIATVASTALFSRRLRARGSPVLSRTIITSLLLFVASARILIQLVSPAMWIPPESARIGGSPSAVTIYPLKIEGDQMTFVQRADKLIRTVPLGQVADRVACNEQQDDEAQRTLASRMGRPNIVGPQVTCPS